MGFVNIHQVLTKLSLPLLGTRKVITIGIKYQFKNFYKKLHCSCNLEAIYLALGACTMLLTVITDLLEQKPLNFDMCTQI